MPHFTCMSETGILRPPVAPPLRQRIPPHAYFLVSAVFHYLGPSFAVLLFAHLQPAGVAWLRIASAGVVFAVWRRPWRSLRRMQPGDLLVVAALGVVLALMNTLFYEAIARLPLATVGAIEFLGPVAVAAAGVRTRRNLIAFLLAIGGVALLSSIGIAGSPLGYAYAFANCGLFVCYILLGHRISGPAANVPALDRLAAAMLVAAVAALPFGIVAAAPAFVDPVLLAAAVGVGISSSVIPYVCDQMAMARLPRASFALLLSLMPASAAVIGLVVLRQVPSAWDAGGIVLVVCGVALHRPEA